MFEIIHSVDAELTWRFSDNELDLISCETVYPNSAFFLNSDYIKPLVDKYSYVGSDTTKLKAQCVVAKQLFFRKHMRKVRRRFEGLGWHEMWKIVCISRPDKFRNFDTNSASVLGTSRAHVFNHETCEKLPAYFNG